MMLLAMAKPDFTLPFSAKKLGDEPVRKVRLGALPLPSGRVVVCDVVTDAHATPESQALASGPYAVELSTVSGQVAFARLVITEGAAVRWVRSPRTIPVDSGIVAFVDATTYARLAKDKGTSLFDDVIEPALSKRDWALVRPEKGEVIAVLYAGQGDGTYRAYWGYDVADEPVAFVADFNLVDHEDLLGTKPKAEKKPARSKGVVPGFFPTFHQKHGAPGTLGPAPAGLLAKYTSLLPKEISTLFRDVGFASYADGFIELVDPTLLAPVVKKWCKRPLVPFLRVGCRDLVAWGNGSVWKLDVDLGWVFKMSSLPVFFDYALTDARSLQAYGLREYAKARKSGGALGAGEAFGPKGRGALVKIVQAALEENDPSFHE
jgi:hypothetical protein